MSRAGPPRLILTAVASAVASVVALSGPALPALASPGPSGPAELPGVPAAALLASGRVLVLRPHRLEVAVNGRVERAIPVEQPLDLGRLPDVVGDPAVAVRTAPGVVRLGAVLLQRPGTVVAGGPLTLELADSGGAGPARLSGTRATLRLHDTTVTAAAVPSSAAPSAPPVVAAGFRYLHESDVALENVTLRGLGAGGAAGVPALRSDGGGRVRLRHVTLVGAGRGVRVDQPSVLDVVGLQVRAAGVALGVVGARHAELSGVRVDAATDALVVEGSQDVVVRGSELRASRDAVRVTDSRGVVLDAVATTGAVRGPVTRAGAGRAVAADTSSSGPVAPAWSPWSPVRGAGAVALLVLAGGVLLELARFRRRRSAPSR